MSQHRQPSTKCVSGKCPEPATSTCSFRAFERNHETGEKIYNGRICGLRLCDEHALHRGVHGEPRCMWHFMVEEREALERSVG